MKKAQPLEVWCLNYGNRAQAFYYTLCCLEECYDTQLNSQEEWSAIDLETGVNKKIILLYGKDEFVV